MFTKKALGLCGMILFGLGTVASFINSNIFVIIWLSLFVISLKWFYQDVE